MKKIIKNYWYLIIFVIIILVFLFIDNNKEEELVINEPVIEEKIVNKVIEEKIIDYYIVDIKGEVKNPGVYKVNIDSRINDVITLAGGLTNNADTSLINLSKKVTDEMNIKIYSKKDVENALLRLNPTEIEVIKEIEKECICPEVNDACDKTENINEEDIKEKSKVNINTASIEELMTINGLGESKANNIIIYRETNKFNSIEDILNVSGIGDALFNKIKEYIEI